MLKLVNIDKDSKYLPEIYKLLAQYGGLIFSELENPIQAFLKSHNKKENRTIGGLKNNKLIAFCLLYNFQRISKENFNCYIYGCSQRGVAKELSTIFSLLLSELKKNGCKVIRLETREYNLPMRHLARRLGFRKVGFLECSSYIRGKFISNILYEKKL